VAASKQNIKQIADIIIDEVGKSQALAILDRILEEVSIENKSVRSTIRSLYHYTHDVFHGGARP